MELYIIRIVDQHGRLLRKAYTQQFRKGHAIREAKNLLWNTPGAARWELV